MIAPHALFIFLSVFFFFTLNTDADAIGKVILYSENHFISGYNIFSKWERGGLRPFFLGGGVILLCEY